MDNQLIQVNLKRLVAKKEVADLIRALSSPSAAPVTIQDAGGKVLYGAAAGDCPGRYPVETEKNVIGWVCGGEEAAALAVALSCIACAELAIKALGRDTLEKYKEITMLYDIAEKLAANLDPKEVAHLVILEAKKLLAADHISIMLLNEETGELEIFAASGREYHPKTRLRTGEGIAGNVVLNGVAEIVNDVLADARYVPGAAAIKSLMCAPLKIKDKTIGVFNVSSSGGVFYTSGDLMILSSLALQSAAAIENARLFADLERSLTQEKKARQELLTLNTAYERFVPHEFLSYLKKESIADVQLGDQTLMDMTVLFSDIRSFTSLSEKMTPKENFQFINSYLEQMEPVVNRHCGFIDKYIGDAIMALFTRGADDALQAAIEMLRALDVFNRKRQHTGKEPVRIGIGLNTGPVILGIVGGRKRMEGTVISDAVNLAARLEALNKLYGTDLLISGKTYMNLTDPGRFCIRSIDRIKVKGKSEFVLVHEVFDVDPAAGRTAKLATKRDFETAFNLYCAQDTEPESIFKARQLFAQCVRENPQDNVARIYLERCRNILQFGREEL